MKTRKRILSLLLAVIMIGTLMPSGVFAATREASGSNVIFEENFESYTSGLPVKWSPSAYGEVFGYPDFQNTTDVLNELHEADGNKSIKLNATACNSVNGTTAGKMKEFRLVVWGMHGIYGAGCGLDESVEKAAQIYMLTAHLPRINTIRDEEMVELAEFFGVKYRKDFLNV